MKNAALFSLLLSMFFLFSCSGNAEQQKLQKTIEATEATVDKENLESASALAKLYEEFANRFIEDDKAPVYLFKAAELYQNVGNFNKSIELFDYYVERYSDREEAGDASFTKGFILENNLNDVKLARKAYEDFLKKYPDHDMAKFVRQNMPTIGKNNMPDFVKELENADVNEDAN